MNQPVVFDISGNGKFFFHNTPYGSETFCTNNKVASSTQGSGPTQTLTLSPTETACWYVDEASGKTIPAGDWEILLDISPGGVGAAYNVLVTIWNKVSHTPDETIVTCVGVTTFGGDVPCTQTGVPQKTLTTDQVVQVDVLATGSDTVSITYDDSATSGDSRTTLPIPEFQEIALPVGVVLMIVLVLGNHRRHDHR